MKNNTLDLKIFPLLFILFNFSCTSDDECNESTISVNFPIKVKLVSNIGENLFNDVDFNPSLLKITDLNNSIVDRAFSQIEINGESLITFQAVNMDSVTFEYDSQDEFYFGFHDIKRQMINCNIEVTNYKALTSNGELVCDCSINEVIEVTLDL